MLRAATSTLARRGISRGAMAPRMSSAFHYSARREEDAKENSSEVAEKEGFLGTGLSHLYAIPVGVAFAVPALEFNWYLVNEETLLASTFLAFCVVAYTQGGAAIANSFKEEANAMVKLQNDAEDEVVAKMQENVQFMKLTENIVDDYKGVLSLTQQSYDKLNAAGKIKPQHDLKVQVEKVLSMIANEEQSAYDKAKTSMMEEATAAVTSEFLSDDALKKAALDNAVAKLTGKAAGSDPVQAAFVKFFQTKTSAAKKADDGSEEKAARTAMLEKMNGIAEAEGMYFRFDTATGTPKLVV